MTLSSNRSRVAFALAAALLAPVVASPTAFAEMATCASPPQTTMPVVHYRTAQVDGVDIFYREAGPADAPVVLLLHGFPTSSHMFRNLIPALADRYHVIAPDYPGFGESAAPDHKTFAYTFGHYADIVDGLLTQLGVKDYAVYLMDYGAPVGYRLALKHPDRVTALIIQNGNAYEEGLKAFWNPIKAYWATDPMPTALRSASSWRRRQRSSSTLMESPTSRGLIRTIGATTSRCSIAPGTRTSSSTCS
jgi:pimeloyl-ACP methyl ester carboxylesterase